MDGITYTYDDDDDGWFSYQEGQWYAYQVRRDLWVACSNPYRSLSSSHTSPSSSSSPSFFTTPLGKLLLVPCLGLLLLTLMGMLAHPPPSSGSAYVSPLSRVGRQVIQQQQQQNEQQRRGSSLGQGSIYDLRLLEGRSPSISVERIDALLRQAGSPATGEGQHIYDLGVKYGIDPIFLLAFFHHESTFGLYGAARSTLSVGNLRSSPFASYERDGFAYFSSYYSGEEAWYWLLTHEGWYFPAGNYTVASIIPHYAPSSDHNDEAGYIAAVESDVDQWRR